MRPARTALLAGLLAAAVALPSLRNGFVEDDLWVVKDRQVLEAPPSAAAVLRAPYWPASFGASLWRPWVLASWAVDYQVSHRPAWFHAVNILWAALAAGLLALLAAHLAGPPAGLIAALLFAVHPVHVEAASSVVGRAELMAATGYALALLCAIRVRESAWWLAGVLLGSALAIGSKEHAATLPVAVVLVLFWLRRGWRDFLAPVLVAAVPIVAYFVLRGAIVGGGGALNAGGLAPGLEGLSLPARAVAMIGVSLEWWRLLFFPAHLSADWSTAQVPVIPGLSPNLALALTLWLAAGIAAWRLKDRVPALWLGLAWFLLAIGPVANVLVPTEVVLAERTLFLPSWGAMLAAACVLALLPRPRLVRGVAAAVVLVFAARAVVRNSAWLDGEHAYSATLHDAPLSYRVLWLRGDDAFAAGRPAAGERLLREAMAAAPGIPGPAEDLAARYSAAGLAPQAVGLLRHAMTLNMARSRPWLMMEDVEVAAHDTAGAARYALLAADQFPKDAYVINRDLGTLLAVHRCAAADRLFESKAKLFSAAGDEEARAAIQKCRGN